MKRFFNTSFDLRQFFESINRRAQPYFQMVDRTYDNEYYTVYVKDCNVSMGADDEVAPGDEIPFTVELQVSVVVDKTGDNQALSMFLADNFNLVLVLDTIGHKDKDSCTILINLNEE